MYNNLENTKNEEMIIQKQYFNARGFKNVNKYLNDYQKDLIKFIFERKEIGEDYVAFLEELGLDIKGRETAEIGKTKFDSIVSTFDTTVITPYHYELVKERLLNYNFFPNKKNCQLIKYNYDLNCTEIKIVPSYIKKIITQNPYNKLNLIGYEHLYNENLYDVIVGVYGHIHDNDKAYKLKMLKELKDKIKTNDFNLEYDCFNNYYFAALYKNEDKKITKKR